MAKKGCPIEAGRELVTVIHVAVNLTLALARNELPLRNAGIAVWTPITLR